MRRALLLAAAAALAACAPKPCTRALCPLSSTGDWSVSGVKSVAVSPGTPLPAVPPDSAVSVRGGVVEFSVNGNRVVAEAGSAFRFSLSSGVPTVSVDSGPVAVAIGSGAVPSPASAGAVVALPPAK